MHTLNTEVEKYVENLLTKVINNTYLYYNLAPTQEVVKKSIELANLLKINNF